MKATLHLIRSVNQDGVEGWLELAVGGPLMALVLFALVAM